MTRGHDAEFVADSQSPTVEPAWLVEVETAGTPLRYTAHDIAVTFDGNEYAAKSFRFNEYTQSLERGSGTMAVPIEDVDGVIKALRMGGLDFRRRRITLMRVSRGHLDDADRVQKDVLIIDRVRHKRATVTFECRKLTGLLAMKIPIRKVTVEDFPGITKEA